MRIVLIDYASCVTHLCRHNQTKLTTRLFYSITLTCTPHDMCMCVIPTSNLSRYILMNLKDLRVSTCFLSTL